MTRTRKGRRTIVVALAVAATALMAAGCSTGTGSSKPQTANTSGPAPKGVTLTLWRSPLDTPAINNLYAAYEKATGNKLNIVSLPSNAYETTVITKWATGTMPDILEFDAGLAQVAQLNPSQKLLDLGSLPFASREGQLAKTSGVMNGHLYAATLGPLADYGLFYNKQVFAAAGLQPPKTYADLAGDCATIKQKTPGVAPIFEAGGDGWPPQILAGLLYPSSANVGDAYVNALVDGSQKINDPNGPFVKGLTAYNELRTSGCFNSDATTAKFTDSANALLKGKAAMVAQFSGAMITQLEADSKTASDTVGFVGLSASGPQVSYTPNLTGTYYVPKTGNATKERAATDFINWITGPGYATYIKDSGGVPTLSGVATPPQTGLNAAVAVAAQASQAPCWLTNLPAATSVGDLADQLLAGQVSPSSVGSKMEIAFHAALKQLK
ncbi:MAG: extracellular solute-binding protein [Actinobacteria bacterium]|nr:extracellular solute-binding protein [Actinomycetota bacterium]